MFDLRPCKRETESHRNKISNQELHKSLNSKQYQCFWRLICCKNDNIFCDFEYISLILFDMIILLNSFLYIECVEKVNIFLFVGLCLIKIAVLNTLGSVKHVSLVKYMSILRVNEDVHSKARCVLKL